MKGHLEYQTLSGNRRSAFELMQRSVSLFCCLILLVSFSTRPWLQEFAAKRAAERSLTDVDKVWLRVGVPLHPKGVEGFWGRCSVQLQNKAGRVVWSETASLAVALRFLVTGTLRKQNTKTERPHTFGYKLCARVASWSWVGCWCLNLWPEPFQTWSLVPQSDEGLGSGQALQDGLHFWGL